MNKLHKLVLSIAMAVFTGCFSQSAFAEPNAFFTPPSTIRVAMYHLDPASGASLNIPCTSNDSSYGCTADSNLGPYPFGSTNPVTVQIEGTAVNNRYLRDVIPQEMSPGTHHALAVQAQAVAARTYAYWHIQQGSQINNSTQFQAFIPRKYDSLPAAQRAIIDTAVQDRHYLSQTTNDNPLFAEFFADIPLRTLNGSFPYLIAVQDPISSHPAVTQQGHGHGLSQNGASRWAFGNRSYLGTLDPWSVTWTARDQILTHYYTGIHIRDANNGNAILTPERRFNALYLNWARPPAFPNGICNRIMVWLHNTGTGEWLGADRDIYDREIGIGYCWGQSCFTAGYLPQSVVPSKDQLVSLTIQPGSGELRIDLYKKSWYESTPTWFSANAAWPRQLVGNFDTVRGCVRYPYITKQAQPVGY